VNTQILYSTRKPKPQPTPAPAKAPALAPDRVTIDWGEQGRLHLNRSKAPESDRQQQPKREGSGVLRPTPVETQRGRAGQVDRYSKLERIRRPKPLWEELAERSGDSRSLEYLAVLKVAADEYIITERATGEIFVSQAFETREHCYDAAVELERVFDIGQVLELRLPETIERIDAIVLAHAWREQVKLKLARVLV
jgi:hypothetical protein